MNSEALLQRDGQRLLETRRFDPRADINLYLGDCMDFLPQLPAGVARLVVTSPPYNIGKPYETPVDLATYVQQQRRVINECVRVLAENGSLCWQVGNYVQDNSVIPLDSLLYPVFSDLGLLMRNRIVWHFEHGLHCSRRFSGRYEVITWFTKSKEYVFNLDPVRVPQKYPSKRYFKGPRVGELSCNPLGKNPGDVWIIPNVKHNHVEKTIHPCQFPVELVERLVLALTNEADLVVDPFMGVGSTAIASLLRGRRAAGAEIDSTYHSIAADRVVAAANGTIRTRPMTRPVYKPGQSSRVQPRRFQQV
jgi:adenine-specific DNA-methyltransferase